MNCCDFEDLTELLAPKKTSKSIVKKKTVTKKEKLFVFAHYSEDAPVQKFVKDSSTGFLETLELDGIENVSWNLGVVTKVWNYYKEHKKNKAWMDKFEDETITPTEDAWVLVRELVKIDMLDDRLKILRFKQLLRTEYKDLWHTIEHIRRTMDHVYTSIKLKKLLQIIVQAINQRLRDFATKESQPFANYERIGVPAHDIIKFMDQKKPMDIITEKILGSNLDLDPLDIFGLDTVRGDYIENKVFASLNRLQTNFKAIKGEKDAHANWKPGKTGIDCEKLDTCEYMSQASEKLDQLSTAAEEMTKYLTKTSFYLGEGGEYKAIRVDSSTEYDIITLVQKISSKWKVCCVRVKKILRAKARQARSKDQGPDPENNLKNIMKQAMNKVRSDVSQSSDESSDDWAEDD